MKKFILLSLLLMFVFGLKAQRNISRKRIEASYYKVHLQEVLVDLSKRTEINIAFNPSDIKPDHLVSIQIKRVELGDLLDVILEPSNLEYKINGGQIVIVPVEILEDDLSVDSKTLQGYVIDRDSKEALPFAYISSPNLNYQAVANTYGFFSISFPDSINQINVSYLGYRDKVVYIEGREDIDILMEPNTYLDEVIIVGNKNRNWLSSHNLETIVDINEIFTTQQFMGQADVIRNLYHSPGVTTAADGLGGFSVRGGNTDQNLVLLDGVPIYNSIHGMGVLSVFSPEVVKSVRFHKSHIPSMYGGRVSSVTDIRTREGNLKKIQGSVGVGLLTAQASLEGPIIQDRVSFLVSARRTLLEPYIGGATSLIKEAEGKAGSTDYFFRDFNAKLQWVVDPKNKLYLSYYSGRDEFDDDTFEEFQFNDFSNSSFLESDWNWGNSLFNLRWTSEINNKSFSTLTIYNTNYNYSALNISENSLDSIDVNKEYLLRSSYFKTNIQDIGLDWNLDYYFNESNKFSVGASIIRHNFTPGILSNTIREDTISYGLFKEDAQSESEFGNEFLNEFNVFSENEFRTENILLNYGLRFTLLNAAGRNYALLQPRAGFKYKLVDDFYAKFSGGIHNQYIHLLTSSGFGIPTDIWINSNEEIKPQTVYQLTTGIESKLAEGLYLNVEGYYKYFDNILNLQEGAIPDLTEDSDFSSEVPVGVGNAWGVENEINYNISRFDINVNYTYSFSTRLFDEVNAGRVFYSRLDRRHQVNTNMKYKLNNNITFNAAYTHLTGHPQTLPTQIDGQLVYLEKNNFRLPDYSRLDMSFQISNSFDWGEQQITLGVFNVMNRQNVYYYYINDSLNDAEETPFRQVSVFPILPNVSYKLHF